MEISFTLEQFLEVVSLYNRTFFPLQILAYVLGLGALVLAWKPRKAGGRWASAILAFFWLWSGAVFFIGYLSRLDPQAYAYGALFVVQGLLLVVFGVVLDRIHFQLEPNLSGWLGALILAYAVVGFPLISILNGRAYPEMVPFGLTPCPTAAFTVGLLLWLEGRPKWYVWLIPVLYALSGAMTMTLGLVEDGGMAAAGLLAGGVLLVRSLRKTED